MATAVIEIVGTQSDEEIVRRVLDGDADSYEVLMRRYNQRLYRVARALLRTPDEAEDVMQDAYVRAYANLGQYSGRARFATWLTAILVHECYARLRKQQRERPLAPFLDDENESERLMTAAIDPEHSAAATQARALLEHAIERLPSVYRSAFILRDVENLPVAEAADCLGISEENLKIRAHRARALLRRMLHGQFRDAAARAFAFDGARCDRIVAGVLGRITRPDCASH